MTLRCSALPLWRGLISLAVLLVSVQTTSELTIHDDTLVSLPLFRTRRDLLHAQNETSISLSVNPTLRRKRRDIFHLYNMMTCTTGCDPLKYKGYGCYCGFLGSGAIVDGIDRCCKIHDYCYGAAICHQSIIYFVPYKWKCNAGRPYCVSGHGQSKGHDLCAHHLCECDRQFAECISHYPCPEKRAKCASNPLRSLG